MEPKTHIHIMDLADLDSKGPYLKSTDSKCKGPKGLNPKGLDSRGKDPTGTDSKSSDPKDSGSIGLSSKDLDLKSSDSKCKGPKGQVVLECAIGLLSLSCLLFLFIQSNVRQTKTWRKFSQSKERFITNKTEKTNRGFTNRNNQITDLRIYMNKK